MTANISVKTKIRVNGQDYASVNDMPPEIRQAYERALARMAGAQHGGLLDTLEKGIRTDVQMASNAKVIFNGQEYSGVDEMPPNVRHLYQAALATIEAGDAATPPEAGRAVQAAPPNGGSSASFPTLPTPGSVRLESVNWRLILVAAAILLLAWLGLGGTIMSP